MTTRKIFYILIGLEIVVLAVLTLIAVKGKSSISLCRYDLMHPYGYITPADVAMIKQIHGNTAKTTCSKNVFTAIYFTVYVLILTTIVYMIILIKRLFKKTEIQVKSDKTQQK